MYMCNINAVYNHGTFKFKLQLTSHNKYLLQLVFFAATIDRIAFEAKNPQWDNGRKCQFFLHVRKHLSLFHHWTWKKQRLPYRRINVITIKKWLGVKLITSS